MPDSPQEAPAVVLPAYDFAPPTSIQPAAAKSPAPSKPPAKGIMGGLAAIGAAILKFGGTVGAFLLKFKFLLLGGKFFLTGITFFLSVFAYTFILGWPVAAGLVFTILVHECGHAWAARQRGLRIAWMVFIPFMGGAVATGASRSAAEGAFVGIMGPVFGTALTGIWFGLFLATSNPVFLVLAWLGFSMHLLNMAPTAPLDGGRIVAVFSPKLLLFGFPFLLLFWRSPIMWLLMALSVVSIVNAWRVKPGHAYYATTPRQRAIFATAYLGLLGILAMGMLASQDLLHKQPSYVKHMQSRRRAGRPVRPQ